MAKGTSPWVWIGCGCVGLIILIVGGCLAAGYFGFTEFKGFVEDLEDPVKRNERAREILGARELPEGYNAQFFLRVPLMMEMVFLSEGEPLEFEGGEVDVDPQDLGDHAFLFLSMRDFENNRRDLERWFEGETDRPPQVDLDMDFDSEEELGRGELDLDPQLVRYIAHRGEVEHDAAIYAAMLIDCPRSDRIRMAYYWFKIDPGVEAPELSGTPADEATLRAFMSHFNLCAR